MKDPFKELEIKEFLKKLRSLRISLTKNNDKIVLRGEEGLTAKEIESIKRNEEIISFIKVNKNKLLHYLSTNEIIYSNDASKKIELYIS